MALTTIVGAPTIVWGTGGILAAPAGAVVESIQLTPKNGEPIDIEGNDGTTVNQVVLRDGFNAKVSCMYDGSKTWPIEGTTMSLAIPFTGAAAGTIPYGEGAGATYAANVVTYSVLIGAPPEISFNKKKEATISYQVSYRPNVTA